MTNNKVLAIDFPDYPFFVGPLPANHSTTLVESLPFRVEVHPRYGIPRVRIDAVVERALADAYASGSMISTPLGSSTLSSSRMDELCTDLVAKLSGDVRGKRILEIGCGTGALLGRLKQLGADVMGCEIGPQGQEASALYDIPVLSEPLHAGLDLAPFDCIFSYGALEHISDLAGFFSACRTFLKRGGLFYHSVPNAELSFEHCRIEDFFHEHVNYFSPENSIQLFALQGFERVEAAPSAAGNELRLSGYLGPRSPSWPGDVSGVIAKEQAAYGRKVERLLSAMKARVGRVESWISQGKSVGFYAGGFVITTMAAKHTDALARVRFFDGDSFKHGCSWLKSLRPIEPPTALRTAPVDVLVICPNHYFEQIHSALMRDIGIPKTTQVIRYPDI